MKIYSNKLKQWGYDFLVWLAKKEQKFFRPSNTLKLKNCPRDYTPHYLVVIHSIFAVADKYVVDYHETLENFRISILESRNEFFSDIHEIGKNGSNEVNDLDVSSVYLAGKYSKIKKDKVLQQLHLQEMLYKNLRWYHEINWENPVPPSETYANAIQQINITENSITGQTLVEMPANNDISDVLAIERAKHTLKERKWERKLRKRMHQTIDILRNID